MPWRNNTDDGFVEVVVDPQFNGDVVTLAATRPVWIVDTKDTHAAIEAAWEVGAAKKLYAVNRCPFPVPDDRENNFFEILGSLDDHYGAYRGVVLHGIEPSQLFIANLEREGVQDRGVFSGYPGLSYGPGHTRKALWSILSGTGATEAGMQTK